MESTEILDNQKCYCIALLNQQGIQEMEEYQFDKYTENMFVETLTYKENLPTDKLSETEKIISIFFNN